MTTSARILVCLALLVVACDEKKPEAAGGAASASAAAPAATPSAEPVAEAASAVAPAPSASSDTSMITGDAKEVVLTMKDPRKEPEKTIKAQAGGSVTVFLPDWPGTVWSVEGNDKTLGKAKEEVIPGFAPGTNGHQFKWATNGPLLKPGQKHKVRFVNKNARDKGAKPNESFTLTIEIA